MGKKNNKVQQIDTAIDTTTSAQNVIKPCISYIVWMEELVSF